MVSKRLLKMGLLVGTAAACGAAALPASASSTYVLEPTGTVTNQAYVENYFNGGLDSYAPNGDGPADNVIFAPLQSPTLQTDFLTTGSKAVNIPSKTAGINSSGAVFFQSVTSVMNLASGYALSGLSFDYAIYQNSSSYTGAAVDPTVTIWSGLNGTGTALQTISLQTIAGGATCAAGVYFCDWGQVTANYSGLAESVTFGGTDIGESAFDSITVTESPVPLPASGGLLLLAAGALAWLLRKPALLSGSAAA